MRLAAFALMVTFFAAARAAPLAARDAPINSRDSFEKASPQKQVAFLMSINPKAVHTTPETRGQIEQVPQVAEMLNGRKLTNKMIQHWLESWQKRHESGNNDGQQD
ncbi:hypothetical protein MVEN_00451800 [Mycena venus]|uniref:RxLR effector protein n=1 Tax=Mycena venus TaxID=2733690 RepID=A0A8H6YR88_9AGAR|nr:hypothetical protein MVEN_00451800 [Mycena venus]